MSKKAAIPDAWDDDWEAQADKTDAAAAAAAESVKPEKELKVSKAERMAKHAETNKKIWESAEAPETFHFLAARENVPLKQEFKPAMKVLSRKPVVQRIDPATGVAKLTLDDEDDEDDDEKKKLPSPEELRLKAQREREEKQRRYDEARARILGTPSGSSTPGATTPPTEEGRETRGKGRGRKGDRHDTKRQDNSSGAKELFDPNYTPKPGVMIQRRNDDLSRPTRQGAREEEQLIRSPRGPDGSGRGGFGFANRGNKS